MRHYYSYGRNGTSWQDVLDWLSGVPEAFTGSSFSGRPGRYSQQGWMPHDEWVKYQTANVEYSVIHFYTVIAYKADGVWCVPDVKYSRRTTAKQNIMRTVIPFLNKG